MIFQCPTHGKCSYITHDSEAVRNSILHTSWQGGFASLIFDIVRCWVGASNAILLLEPTILELNSATSGVISVCPASMERCQIICGDASLLYLCFCTTPKWLEREDALWVNSERNCLDHKCGVFFPKQCSHCNGSGSDCGHGFSICRRVSRVRPSTLAYRFCRLCILPFSDASKMEIAVVPWLWLMFLPSEIQYAKCFQMAAGLSCRDSCPALQTPLQEVS